MDKTPVMSRSRLSCRRNNVRGTSAENEPKENTHSATSFLETRMFTDIENDESPVHIACTQEGCENVDVVWDWNSPQTTRKRSQKRLILQSPKIPLKRHPSNNQVQDFEKLREELQSLREQIAIPDNEDSLVLSPLDEAEYKDMSDVLNKSAVTPETQDNLAQDEDDLFDDSVDEQLILFSQKVESELNAVGQTTNSTKHLEIKNATVQILTKKPICDSSSSVKVNHLGVHGLKSEIGEIAKSAHDFFDTMLQEINVEKIDMVTDFIDRRNVNQDTKNNNHRFPRTSSQNQFTTSKQMNSGKGTFPRTHSFESTLDKSKEIIPQSKLDEIERKRKEALAKLELKKKQEFSDSIVKCTPQEIERKRLEALAKREAKRQQLIIERNRQEALKRLELSRRKNVTVINNSVTKR